MVVLEQTCAHCGAQADDATIVCCASCQCAFYCCEQHQLLDWKRHKSQCKTTLARKREQLFEQKQAQAAAASASTTLEENSGNNETSTTKLPGTISEQEKQKRQPEEATTKIDAPALKSLPVTNNNEQQKKQRSESVSPSPFKAPFSVLDFRSRSGSASVIANGATSTRIPTSNGAAAACGDDPCAATYADQQQGTSSRVLGVQGVLEQSCSTASATSAEPCPSQVKLNLRNVIEGLSRKLLAPVDGIEKFDHSLNKPLNLAKNENYMRMVSGLPRNTAFSFHVRRIAEHVGSALNRFGWAVVDSLVGAEAAEEVLKEVESMNANNMFEDAKLAKGEKECMPTNQVRGDKVLWIDNAPEQNPNIAYVVSVLDSVVFACGGNIRKNCRVAGKSKAMISLFPGNASRYILHVDNPNRDGRLITVIYNMNKNLQAQDGGLLTLHPISALKGVPIEPVLDRAIFLWSDRRCPYEVEPTYFNRYSMTIWYYDGDEKADAWLRAQEAARQRAAVIQMANVRKAQKVAAENQRLQQELKQLGGGKRGGGGDHHSAPDAKRHKKSVAATAAAICVVSELTVDAEIDADDDIIPPPRVCKKCRDHACRATVRWNRRYVNAKKKAALAKAKALANPPAATEGQNGTGPAPETEGITRNESITSTTPGVQLQTGNDQPMPQLKMERQALASTTADDAVTSCDTSRISVLRETPPNNEAHHHHHSHHESTTAAKAVAPPLRKASHMEPLAIHVTEPGSKPPMETEDLAPYVRARSSTQPAVDSALLMAGAQERLLLKKAYDEYRSASQALEAKANQALFQHLTSAGKVAHMPTHNHHQTSPLQQQRAAPQQQQQLPSIYMQQQHQQLLAAMSAVSQQQQAARAATPPAALVPPPLGLMRSPLQQPTPIQAAPTAQQQQILAQLELQNLQPIRQTIAQMLPQLSGLPPSAALEQTALIAYMAGLKDARASQGGHPSMTSPSQSSSLQNLIRANELLNQHHQQQQLEQSGFRAMHQHHEHQQPEHLSNHSHLTSSRDHMNSSAAAAAASLLNKQLLSAAIDPLLQAQQLRAMADRNAYANALLNAAAASAAAGPRQAMQTCIDSPFERPSVIKTSSLPSMEQILAASRNMQGQLPERLHSALELYQSTDSLSATGPAVPVFSGRSSAEDLLAAHYALKQQQQCMNSLNNSSSA